EQDEEDGDEVVAHVELHARIFEGLEAALVGGQLLGIGPVHAQNPGRTATEQRKRDAERQPDADEHQDRKVLSQHIVSRADPGKGKAPAQIRTAAQTGLPALKSPLRDALSLSKLRAFRSRAFARALR